MQNLANDKHHLVAEVDKLRDQRTRLEQVSVHLVGKMETRETLHPVEDFEV